MTTPPIKPLPVELQLREAWARLHLGEFPGAAKASEIIARLLLELIIRNENQIGVTAKIHERFDRVEKRIKLLHDSK